MRNLNRNEIENVSGGAGVPGAAAGFLITSVAVVGNSMVTGEWNGLRMAAVIAAGTLGGALGNPMAGTQLIWRLNIAYSGGVASGVISAYNLAGSRVGTVSVGELRLAGTDESGSATQSMYDPFKEHPIGYDDYGQPIYGAGPGDLRRFTTSSLMTA
jgi:hypothetical protein